MSCVYSYVVRSCICHEFVCMYVCCAFVHYVCMYVMHSYNVRCMRIYAYVPLCVCIRVHASTSHILTYICCVFVGMRCVYAYIVCSSVCLAFECMSCIRAYICLAFVCMYVCMYVCIYVCMHMCMCMCRCRCKCRCMCMCVCLCLCLYLSCMYNIAARIRNKQKCSSIDTEMLLIRDGPGRSVLGLGRSGTVRSASGMVRGGPGSSVLAPCSSVVLPSWVRVDNVFRPSIISRGTVEACSPRFTPDRGISWSGVFRGYPGWSVLGPALVWLRLKEGDQTVIYAHGVQAIGFGLIAFSQWLDNTRVALMSNSMWS